MNRLSVSDVGNHAKRERCAADENLVGVHAIDILARNHGPLDLVIVAAAADKRNVVHAGKRIRNFRTVEEDSPRSQIGMDSDIQELLRELIPVRGDTGAAQQRWLVVFRSRAAWQSETEQRHAAGGNNFLVDV